MKKQVNVLIVEPKPSLLEQTKRLISEKEDEQYDFRIVGTASTGKAGYFVLARQQPHLLFFNPELEDEDGISFIQYALKRIPYLKIVVTLSSREINEQKFRDLGVHEVFHIPFQRQIVLKKIDRMVQELDGMNVLKLAKPPSPEEKESKMFVVSEDEEVSFVPIFENVLEENKKNEPSSPSTTKSNRPNAWKSRATNRSTGSNRLRTNSSLYSGKSEYNKTSLNEGLSFERGYTNREGLFVPVVPPRELFQFLNQSYRSESELEEDFSVVNEKKWTSSEEGILSSVKKIFKR